MIEVCILFQMSEHVEFFYHDVEYDFFKSFLIRIFKVLFEQILKFSQL